MDTTGGGEGSCTSSNSIAGAEACEGSCTSSSMEREREMSNSSMRGGGLLRLMAGGKEMGAAERRKSEMTDGARESELSKSAGGARGMFKSVEEGGTKIASGVGDLSRSRYSGKRDKHFSISHGETLLGGVPSLSRRYRRAPSDARIFDSRNESAASVISHNCKGVKQKRQIGRFQNGSADFPNLSTTQQ